ncbi:MAG: hypothetical protein PHO15_09670 [Eubacteriales bacterium]|nr:hypothetical protein [Eubacteriales bacterium]
MKKAVIFFAAAIVLCGLYACVGMQCAAQADAAQNDDAQPTDSAGAVHTAQEIVYAEDALPEDEMVPEPGTCYIGHGLQSAMDDPSNDGALFYVYLQPYYLSDIYADRMAAFTYDGKTVEAWETLYSEYGSGYNDFVEEKMMALEPDDSYDKYAWMEEWAGMHGEDPTLSLEAARREQRNMLTGLETERLRACGISVTIEEYSGSFQMYGFLTKKQVLNFPCGDCGYYLLLAQNTEDGIDTECIDE